MNRIWGTLDVESGGVLVEEEVGESCCLEKYGSNAIKFVLFPLNFLDINAFHMGAVMRFCKSSALLIVIKIIPPEFYHPLTAVLE